MTTTTLAHALSAADQTITLTAANDLVKGELLALDAEYCRILVVLTPTQALVQRGVNGTPSAPHIVGVTVSIDVPENFLTGPQVLPAFGIDTNVLTGLGPSDAATFQPGGGGGGGNPALPDTSVQFNDSGAFGGSADFTWDGSHAFVSGSQLITFDDLASPPLGTALGSSGAKYTDYFGSGNINVGDSSLLPGSTTFHSYIAEAASNDNTLNHEPALFTIMSAHTDTANPNELRGLWSRLKLDGNGDYTSQYLMGVDSGVQFLGPGNVTDNLVGIRSTAYNAQGNVGSMYGTLYSVESDSGSVGLTVGAWSDLLIYGGSVTTSYGFYSTISEQDGTLANAVSFYSGAIGGLATNAYSFWSDEQGVFRIRSDNTFNTVYQAIPALYNPQFTKYTPGATDFERIVLQWESNVGTLTTEKGGTGTLRALNLGDTSVQVQVNGKNLTLANSFTTSGNFAVTQTYTNTTNVTFPTTGTLATLAGSEAFTNKTGNISQWTNDTGYLTSVTGHNLLSATHPDTTAASVVRGDVVTGQGASPTWKRLAKGTANQVLAMDGTATDVLWVTPASGGVTSIATTSPISGGTITSTGTISLLVNTDHLFTASQSVTITGLATSSTDGFVLANTTPATSIATVQQSPRLRLRAQVWNTTSVAATNTNDFFLESVPVSGTTPSGLLKFGSSLNGASATYPMTLTSAGNLFLLPAGDNTTTALQLRAANNGISADASGTPNGMHLVANGSYSGFLNSTQFRLTSTQDFGFSSGSSQNTGLDVILNRAAAATLQMGDNVNGAAVNQTLQAANGITGTDKTGGNLTIASGKGTGAGAVSSLIFQTPTVLSTGTTAQSLATRLTLTSAGATFAAGITTLGGATFHTTSSALTDGAGAGLGTLATAPAAGNPTKWIGINDNGTTRYIPAW